MPDNRSACESARDKAVSQLGTLAQRVEERLGSARPRPRMPNPHDEIASTEKRWSRSNPNELQKEIDLMRRAGCKPDAIERAERYRDKLRDDYAHKYPERAVDK